MAYQDIVVTVGLWLDLGSLLHRWDEILRRRAVLCWLAISDSLCNFFRSLFSGMDRRESGNRNDRRASEHNGWISSLVHRIEWNLVAAHTRLAH